MEENKNIQPDPELSPEEQLDLLLAEFLATPDMELPTPPPQVEVPLPTLEFAADAEPPVEVEIEPAPEAEIEIAPETEAAVAMEPELSDASEEIPEAEAPIEPEIEPEVSADETEPTDTEEEIPSEQPPAVPEIVALEEVTIGESLADDSESAEIGVDEQALEAAGLTTVEHPVTEDGEADAEEVISIPTLINTAPQENPEDKESEEMDNAPAPEEQKQPQPIRKIKPKKKGQWGLLSLPHMAATIIWLAIILFIGVGLGNILWEYASDMLAFDQDEIISVEISIDEGDTVDDITRKLQEKGLIKYPGFFKLYADLTDAANKIRIGDYTLTNNLDYKALVSAMASNAARLTSKVVIPEGYSCQQIFYLLEAKDVCSATALQKAAMEMDLSNYWFLDGVVQDNPNCLEGYLFPDTYEFYRKETPENVLAKLLANFNRRFNNTMRENIATINEQFAEMLRKNGMSEEYIVQHQLTIREVVIIASMIEREAANTSEGYTIASVIYNRLANPNAYPYLQIDATLVYYTGHNELTLEDLATDHPYNTYLRPGLVPGPISNPSRASLDAALDPSITTYYYYALNPATGEHKFSETLEEHEAFLESLRGDQVETKPED